MNNMPEAEKALKTKGMNEQRGVKTNPSPPYPEPISGHVKKTNPTVPGILSVHTITDGEFSRLAAYIKANFGINLKKEKRTLVINRLHHVLAQNGFSSFSEYYEHIISDKTGKAAETLVNRITTNHTYFMREPDHFNFFREAVLPYLKETVKDKDMRIWSAGCSTGEEPYTLAMIINEFLDKSRLFWDAKILATDISNKVLEIAGKGVYDKEGIAKIPAHWKYQYFKETENGKVILRDSIRNEVIFRSFNLMDQVFPFKKKFHAIFCRNVMIYFDAEAKEKLTNRFYDLLEPGGYLFIGHSESLNRKTTRFHYIKPAVYRKE